MKILFLTYYFEPDLSAGSFRNTSLFEELKEKISENDNIEVITTKPNRYDSYKVKVNGYEEIESNIIINRIEIPNHENGLIGQIRSFKVFYLKTLKIVSSKKYDIVYASSSRLFTAYLGAKIAKKKNAQLYLDIRDIFRESIVEIFKNKIIKFFLDLSLRPIEYITFGRANHINLVSKGFASYFEKYKNCSKSYFTNGIDHVFLEKQEVHLTNLVANKPKKIMYAGNIGEGQGLDLIIPHAALQLSNEYQFIIFGDGGAKQELIDKIDALNVKNVFIHDPVDRKTLIEEYEKADFLFLHLNKYKAFERVLPSKIFEYSTFNKPIIAGVGGYAGSFLREEMENVILFVPGDIESLVRQLSDFQYCTLHRSSFLEKFSRKSINKGMVESILAVK